MDIFAGDDTVTRTTAVARAFFLRKTTTWFFQVLSVPPMVHRYIYVQLWMFFFSFQWFSPFSSPINNFALHASAFSRRQPSRTKKHFGEGDVQPSLNPASQIIHVHRPDFMYSTSFCSSTKSLQSNKKTRVSLTITFC
eukprot:GEMP01074114.1.p1 GENE.GEMP01074114.1~~GEMP01074114.1.p1  ORF type:complete len:138 (-),score=11.00 GEMP01074114.1:311-724(-)